MPSEIAWIGIGGRSQRDIRWLGEPSCSFECLSNHWNWQPIAILEAAETLPIEKAAGSSHVRKM
jgi:hypothetical protein